MSLFVKVENEEVTQVWDTQPPAGEAGWQSAVEVRPSITDGKQIYTAHTFDLSADPVQIVYGVEDLTVAQRKANLISKAKGDYQQYAWQSGRSLTNFLILLRQNLHLHRKDLLHGGPF